MPWRFLSRRRSDEGPAHPSVGCNNGRRAGRGDLQACQSWHSLLSVPTLSGHTIRKMGSLVPDIRKGSRASLKRVLQCCQSNQHCCDPA